MEKKLTHGTQNKNAMKPIQASTSTLVSTSKASLLKTTQTAVASMTQTSTSQVIKF